MTRRFAFVPRYRALALSAIGVGGGFAAIGAFAIGVGAIATGAVGAVLGAAYLLSPAWKLEVVVDDATLEVTAGGKRRFQLAWGDIVRVVAAANGTCFVDGGAPESSLLVPGVGAPAPYDLRDKQALYDFIVAHVAPERIERVDTLEAALAARAT